MIFDSMIVICCLFASDIPKEFKSDFVSNADKQKLDSLKTRIRGSGLEVFDM